MSGVRSRAAIVGDVLPQEQANAFVPAHGGEGRDHRQDQTPIRWQGGVPLEQLQLDPRYPARPVWHLPLTSLAGDERRHIIGQPMARCEVLAVLGQAIDERRGGVQVLLVIEQRVQMDDARPLIASPIRCRVLTLHPPRSAEAHRGTLPSLVG